MIGAEKQYEFVCEQIIARNNAIGESFKIFLQLFSAIVGGSVWISITKQIPTESRKVFAKLSITLASLVTFVTIVLIIENVRAWRGYRLAQVRLDADNIEAWRIPPPHIFRASLGEAVMIAAMLVATVAFAVFNPFRISN